MNPPGLCSSFLPELSRHSQWTLAIPPRDPYPGSPLATIWLGAPLGALPYSRFVFFPPSWSCALLPSPFAAHRPVPPLFALPVSHLFFPLLPAPPSISTIFLPALSIVAVHPPTITTGSPLYPPIPHPPSFRCHLPSCTLSFLLVHRLKFYGVPPPYPFFFSPLRVLSYLFLPPPAFHVCVRHPPPSPTCHRSVPTSVPTSPSYQTD